MGVGMDGRVDRVEMDGAVVAMVGEIGGFGG